MQDRHADSAFAFQGSWREYAPIALTNLLLTIVTLGIYRFWATARTRRYLWSRTRFVDETLEWTGTGKELFFGFLIVMLVLFLPLFGLQFIAQRLILEGQEAFGTALIALQMPLFFYLGGVAAFRALRYRLSRTRWHGIRGGSDDAGWGYGGSYAWKTAVGVLPLGLLIPWSMVSLWNERWNKMSFGPHSFESHGNSGGIYARFLLFYLTPLVVFLGFGLMAALGVGLGVQIMDESVASFGFIGAIIAMVLFFYLGLGLIAVAFYAKFYREMLGALTWRGLRFSFEASTWEWIKLLLGDVLLVVATLGLGIVFIAYRHWKFLVTHLEADGEILLDELTQSTTRQDRHGEGLLDAFDMGAI